MQTSEAAAPTELYEHIHHCLGAPLARLELKLVLEEMLASYPGYVCGEGTRVRSHFIRGFAELPGRLRE